MDVRKVKEVNGVDIYFDLVTNRFFYWENGKKRTSVSISNLINKLSKK